MPIKYKKESIHATVSPYVKKKAEELVATEEFSSMSDLVNIALAEFIGKYAKETEARDESSDIKVLENRFNELINALTETDKEKIRDLVKPAGGCEAKEPIVISESVEKVKFK
ncbi:hypothetical protein [Methanococcoides vulcani]|nr:hypothetical protein [Methanococcoides vulcani]